MSTVCGPDLSFSTVVCEYLGTCPEKIPIKAAQGFLLTGILRLLTGATKGVALLTGTVAAIATLVEAVTRPIIQTIFANYPNITWLFQMTASLLVAVSLTAYVAPWAGITYAIDEIAFPFLSGVIMGFLNQGSISQKNAMVIVI